MTGEAGSHRSTMSLLFTDIVGSTQRWELVPEMRHQVQQHFAALHASISQAGGRVFATMGDGVAAAFTSADAAVRAAIDAQLAMADIGLSVRIGIHTGEVEPVGDDFLGRSVNRAARVMGLAHGGQVLLSDVTARLVRSVTGDVGLADLGSHRLRDLAEPERLWQVMHPDLPTDFPPPPGTDLRPNNLPLHRSSLVGRDADVCAVANLLAQHRIVTLTGAGGVGKTRLAVQVAAETTARFVHVAFIELASVADAGDVPGSIARGLGAGTPTDPLRAAIALLANEQTLLIVDNCEHVVDAAAEAIDVLTAECPALHVLATSREPLGIDGEHVKQVRSLDPATTASELFRQRATAAGTDVGELDNAAIEHICERLDGIPMAIELAAARASTLGIPAVTAALDDRFSLLNGGRRRAVDRHATMRATIDWSYRLLPSQAQRLLQRLAVFGNGFELDAAHHIGATLRMSANQVTDEVASLVHRSMLNAEPHPTGVRYRLLETMRAFVFERLDESGERLATQAALADWVATITDLSVDEPVDAAAEQGALRLERESDNWRDAVILATRLRDGTLAARLCGPPTALFLLGRHDLGEHVAPLLELTAADPLGRRSVLCALAVSTAGSTSPAQLHEWATEVEALDALRPCGAGGLIRWLAFAWEGDFVTSTRLCEAASRDVRFSHATRDLFVGIACLDHFSLTDATDDSFGLIERAIEVAARSDVAFHRVTCLLGAAWGLADTDSTRALQFVRQALEHIDRVPALTRLTLPGSASRLLARLDPRVAATGLLEQLASAPTRRSFVDVIPLVYATAVLHRVGHPLAGSAAATLSVSSIAPYLSMMDFVALARDAAANRLVSVADLESMIREALAEIAGLPPAIERRACPDRRADAGAD